MVGKTSTSGAISDPAMAASTPESANVMSATLRVSMPTSSAPSRSCAIASMLMPTRVRLSSQ
jgi:hypothetical protein